MYLLKRALVVAILGTCGVAMAQPGSNQTGSSQSAAGRPKTRHTKPKMKTQEEILLLQLNEKFQKLDELNQKYDLLQQKLTALEKQMATRDAESASTRNAAAAAQTAAAEADKKIQATQQVVGPDGSGFKTLQNDVADLKTSSTTLSTKVEATQEQAKKLEHPETIHYKGVDLTPGGYLAAETVNRQRAIGGDINTQFTGIPFAGQTAGVLSEFNASGRQSRISLLVEGKLPSATLRGYYEADFLSTGTTSNNNQSNSYTLRQRQAWAQAELNSGWTLTGGQMWSLATEYKKGLTNRFEAIPLTIDPQYNVGFTWERQYGFRVVKRISDRFWIGGALEEPQTLNIGGHNLPTILYHSPQGCRYPARRGAPRRSTGYPAAAFHESPCRSGTSSQTVGVAGSAKFSVNGGRVEYNTFEVDGSDVLNTSINASRGQGEPLMVYPSIDAIQDVKVITANYSALYGKSASGSVLVTTKSGTDQFHGIAYGFLRNELFNARNYFDQPNPIPQGYQGKRTYRTPLYRRLDFGGTIGGPIYIPNHYNKERTKTYFFFSEEVRREKTPVDYNQAVPTMAERAGNFSDVCPLSVPGESPDFNVAAYPDCPRGRSTVRTVVCPLSAGVSLSITPLPLSSTVGLFQRKLFERLQFHKPKSIGALLHQLGLPTHSLA